MISVKEVHLRKMQNLIYLKLKMSDFATTGTLFLLMNTPGPYADFDPFCSEGKKTIVGQLSWVLIWMLRTLNNIILLISW